MDYIWTPLPAITKRASNIETLQTQSICKKQMKKEKNFIDVDDYN